MKVAMVTPWGKRIRCGIRTYSENLVGALANLGVEVYVVRLPRFGKKMPELLQLVVDQIPFDKVDLVHIQEEYGLYQGLEGGFYGALVGAGKQLVSTMHAVGNWEVDSVVSEVSDKVIVHNKFCQERFGHSDKTVVIPHGCAIAECVPMEGAKESYGLKPDWPIVGYLGFISQYKGLETLIEAMEGITDAGLIIGGGWHTEVETTYIAQLKQRSFEALPGRCQWMGFVPDEDLPRAYGAMDVVVYPSRFATESGALLTALSHGKAVIASNLTPFREKKRHGALTTFKDVSDLRRKIRKLLKDGDARRDLEKGARRYAEENSWPKVAERHLELYGDLT